MHYSLDKIIKLAGTSKVVHGFKKFDGLQSPASYIEVNSTKYYLIGNLFYTTDLNEIVSAQKVYNTRMMNSALFLTTKVFHLSYEELSIKAKAYIISNVESSMKRKNRNGFFSIEDIYFTNGCRSDIKRSLCIVIKHSDSSATEALYFKV